MKLPVITKLFQRGAEGVAGTAGQAIKTWREYRRIEKYARARVLYSDGETIYGLEQKERLYADVNSDRGLARIKGLDRIFIVVKTYRTAKGEPLILISDRYHRSADLERMRDWARIEKKNSNFIDKLEAAVISKENSAALALEELKASDLDVSVSMNCLDNDLSREFTADADKIMTTNAYRLLDDIPNRTLILVGAVCLLGGLLLGTLSNFLLVILIELAKLLIK